MGGCIPVCMERREPLHKPAVLSVGADNCKDPEGSSNGDGHLPGMARPTVVAWNGQRLMRLATAFAISQAMFCTSSSDVIRHDHTAIMAGDRSMFIRQAARAAGISDTSVEQILRRWQDAAKRHDRPFRLYLEFCKAEKKCGICEAVPQLVNYASRRLEYGFSGANF